jgi:hypothetical protein
MEEAAKETVIIVHGTYAAPKPGVSRWYQPAEGVPATEFITKLNHALQKRGSAARCGAHCSQSNQGFHWSGENSWIDRTRAASELGNYVLNLRKEGWLCHIVAHSHGGNVVLEALPRITTALPSSTSLGKIVTLGTPFMDTMSPILQKIRTSQSFLIGISWITLIWLILLPATIWTFVSFAGFGELGAVLATVSTLFVPVIVFALLFFSLKRQNDNAIFNRAAQMQPKFLAIGSTMDEPWQLLHHMRNAANPMAVDKTLIRYLVSSMQSDISRSRELARIYEAKSYRDLNLVPKLFLGLTHLLFLLFLYFALGPNIWYMIEGAIRYGDWQVLVSSPNLEGFVVSFVGWSVLILLLTRIFGTAFYSAFFAPFRWCVYRLGAIKGIFREIATYIVRSRGWSVVLAIALGLEGYRHQLPRIEQYPSSLPGNFVTYENMPAGAQERALAKRGAWIDRHLDNIAQTFSKLVVTSADITMLQHAIEADQTLVHAAYYTDDECVARIADWIAAKDDVPSNAIIAAEARGEA